ncbi:MULTISPECIES: 1,2-phenylacetyl-CoA epoxidase subunit PaaC [Cryobacterium]|uniref:Phenylacetate-CoA oxygenase subunit PaaI n=1 Tax=Cryobacterium levicorallinum TaxID=995038 RepID=A0A1I3D2Q6_9MICO|nr:MULTISPECIES: 1,2-phenylacetyl-CoA epoxidase subunit PaaC [Cryobacterium]TFB86829.1 phenylacetate-CoA oxygenase subunit PaaI [Cryobacterium levicorallinum]TFD61258.1 phenylacetate-CoA oxygenase subunit PaaI [Cryobacterium sp. Hh38]GEP28119.1 putative phenylacetic acid degradation protein PaaC/phenylacetate-CoA oxygenase, PaaI subunit [Cryobacterium levicorallinum]SFH80993.1 ring-1,2-phenylacetyl-CoA epoxidase subunit PaaC [Cryobacterium levicorallinum]
MNDDTANNDSAEADVHGHVAVEVTTLDAELIEGPSVATADIAEYAVWLGDDSLVLAQQLGAWISRAPELEEDVALGNVALDLIGHARSLLHYAGTATDRSEDDLAYWRTEPDFRSLHIVEQPNGDFAHTIARQFVVSHYLFELYSRLRASADPTLAAIAAKAVKEVDYHRDHSTQWVLRLAEGTDESRRRMITAMSDLWPYVEEIFRDDPLIDRLEGIAVRPSSLRPAFDSAIAPVLAEAELDIPVGFVASGGGRTGKHSEHLAFLLAEMQVLTRAHPGASW